MVYAKLWLLSRSHLFWSLTCVDVQTSPPIVVNGNYKCNNRTLRQRDAPARRWDKPKFFSKIKKPIAVSDALTAAAHLSGILGQLSFFRNASRWSPLSSDGPPEWLRIPGFRITFSNLANHFLTTSESKWERKAFFFFKAEELSSQSRTNVFADIYIYIYHKICLAGKYDLWPFFFCNSSFFLLTMITF